MLLWSTVATGFKLGLTELEPLELLWLGSAVVVRVLRGGEPRHGTRRLRSLRLRARDWLRLGALGLLNPFLYYVVLFEAYDRLPAQIAQPLNYTWAITLALLAVPLLGQRMSCARGIAGMLVSYCGVVMLLSQGRIDGFADVDGIGVALALGSTLIWATYWLATVRASDDPLVMMTASFAVGAIAIGIACQIEHGLPALSSRRIGFGAWVGLVEMGVTFLLWQQALRRHRARRAHRTADLSVAVPVVDADRSRARRTRAREFVRRARGHRRRSSDRGTAAGG